MKFKKPFKLAHGTRLGTDVLFLELDYLGVKGYGEACLPPYLSEDIHSVRKWVKEHVALIKDCNLLFPLKYPSPYDENHPAASAALEMVILSWWMNNSGGSLQQLFKISEKETKTTLTFSKSDRLDMSEKLRVLEEFSHIKLKLTGDEDDMSFVKYLTGEARKPFCVDMNQGFKTREQAIIIIDKLNDLGCVFVEQPFHKKDIEGHYWLKERTSCPIVADESICSVSDIKEYNQAFDGVNMKLMKSGGFRQTLKMIDYIDGKLKFKFIKLIGCMSESSLGVGMAAPLAYRCHYADLDGPLLISNDPFEGFSVEKSVIKLKSIRSTRL